MTPKLFSTRPQCITDFERFYSQPEIVSWCLNMGFQFLHDLLRMPLFHLRPAFVLKFADIKQNLLGDVVIMSVLRSADALNTAIKGLTCYWTKVETEELIREQLPLVHTLNGLCLTLDRRYYSGAFWPYLTRQISVLWYPDLKSHPVLNEAPLLRARLTTQFLREISSGLSNWWSRPLYIPPL